MGTMDLMNGVRAYATKDSMKAVEIGELEGKASALSSDSEFVLLSP